MENCSKRWIFKFIVIDKMLAHLIIDNNEKTIIEQNSLLASQQQLKVYLYRWIQNSQWYNDYILLTQTLVINDNKCHRN